MAARMILGNPFILIEGNLYEKVEKLERKREKSLSGLRYQDIDRTLIADIRFEEEKIIQNKVRIVKTALEDKKNFEQKAGIIDDYTEFIHKCWRNGFHEETYNFTINNGYNSEGKMVLIDPGELCFTKEKVLKQIKNEKWLTQHSYTKDLSQSLQDYFKDKMREEVAEEKLDTYWKDNVKE